MAPSNMCMVHTNSTNIRSLLRVLHIFLHVLVSLSREEEMNSGSMLTRIFLIYDAKYIP